MPWKETDPMNERVQVIAAYLSDVYSMSATSAHSRRASIASVVSTTTSARTRRWTSGRQPQSTGRPRARCPRSPLNLPTQATTWRVG